MEKHYSNCTLALRESKMCLRFLPAVEHASIDQSARENAGLSRAIELFALRSICWAGE